MTETLMELNSRDLNSNKRSKTFTASNYVKLATGNCSSAAGEGQYSASQRSHGTPPALIIYGVMMKEQLSM